MRTALVVDWLDRYGGAERVIAQLCRMFDGFDERMALVDVMEAEDKKRMCGAVLPFRTTALQSAGARFRYFLPLFPLFAKGLKVPSECDLLISSSHAVAKAADGGQAKHVCYMQARNMKYIWDEQERYFRGWRRLMRPLLPLLRRWDVASAQRPDVLVANSTFVQAWIRKVYGRESVVIHPPVDVDYFVPQPEKGDYFITVGRLEPYKRFDIVIGAFNRLELPLLVVGDGSLRRDLETAAGDTVRFTGYLTREQLRPLLAGARAFVFAGTEDFGIAAVEALASGTPVIGHACGGMLDIVRDGLDGILCEEATAETFAQAVHRFESHTFDAFALAARAGEFSFEVFAARMRTLVAETMAKRGTPSVSGTSDGSVAG